MLADWQIRDLCVKMYPQAEHGGCELSPLPKPMIWPFVEGRKRPGEVSYGLTSYGYDIRLGNKFKVFTNSLASRIDPKKFDPQAYVEVDVPDHEQLWIPPNSHVLGETVEVFDIPRHVLCFCLGKSTYARCSLIVNVTPLEPEWKGRLTLEISNTCTLPVCVYAGEGVAQLLFSTSDGEFAKFSETLPNWHSWRMRDQGACQTSYADKRGKYQGQEGLTHSKVD